MVCVCVVCGKCVCCVCTLVCMYMCVRRGVCMLCRLWRTTFQELVLSFYLEFEPVSFLFLRLHCVLQTSSSTYCQLILLLPPILLVFGTTYVQHIWPFILVLDLVQKERLPTEPSLQPNWTISQTQLNHLSNPAEPSLQPIFFKSTSFFFFTVNLFNGIV